jgi:hypothetical protein
MAMRSRPVFRLIRRPPEKALADGIAASKKTHRSVGPGFWSGTARKVCV